MAGTGPFPASLAPFRRPSYNRLMGMPEAMDANASRPSAWRWSGQNPLLGFAVTLEFSSPFPSQAIGAVGQTHPQFRKELPRRNEQQMLQMQLGGAMGAAFQRSPQAIGFAFDRLKANGEVERSLTVAMNTVTYVSTSYTRWAEVWGGAKPILAIVLEHLVAQNPLATIVLEYTDRFYWDGPKETARVGSLLVPSPFVASNVFHCDDLWHCHHGFFHTPAGGQGGRLLENVNLNCQNAEVEDVGNTRCLDITTNHRFIFDAPFLLTQEGPFEGLDGAMGLEERLGVMHLRNKELLASLLHTSVAAAIPGLGTL